MFGLDRYIDPVVEVHFHPTHAALSRDDVGQVDPVQVIEPSVRAAGHQGRFKVAGIRNKHRPIIAAGQTG